MMCKVFLITIQFTTLLLFSSCVRLENIIGIINNNSCLDNSVFNDNNIEDNNIKSPILIRQRKNANKKTMFETIHKFKINPKPSDEILALNNDSEILLAGTKLLLENYKQLYGGINTTTFMNIINHHGYKIKYKDVCKHLEQKISCEILKYRTYDGSCNNMKNPQWGKVNTAYSRLAPACYNDGIYEPVTSSFGKVLPSPRLISTRLFPDKGTFSNKYTNAVMAWGQFLTHDMSYKIAYQTDNEEINCCSEDGHILPNDQLHHACMPISIPENDEFYSQYGRKCLNIVRSMTVPAEKCTLGPAQQINSCSSYIDASHIYGKNEKDALSLRTFKNGKLLISYKNDFEFLPYDFEKRYLCDNQSPSDVCFKTGDHRANRNLELTVLHGIFLREHNRLSKKLTQLNPHWNDEKIYQESRKIVIAEIQHITYNEWLPIILGDQYSSRFNMTDPKYETYDELINASIINAFSTSAFRFFHTSIPNGTSFCPYNRKSIQIIPYSNLFNRPTLLNNSTVFDEVLLGMTATLMGKSDHFYSHEMTRYLFRSFKKFGGDIVSVDIQRGRDHGIANYNTYRKICGLKYANSFEDLRNEIRKEDINLLKTIYDRVNDIELMVGGSLEIIKNGELGPTFKCIVAEQFFRTKIGDRFFYTYLNQPHSFSSGQLDEIRKIKLSTILCNNGYNISSLQYHSFLRISNSNPLKACFNMADINLTHWKEK